jgi:hypothetical protein
MPKHNAAFWPLHLNIINHQSSRSTIHCNVMRLMSCPPDIHALEMLQSAILAAPDSGFDDSHADGCSASLKGQLTHNAQGLHSAGGLCMDRPVALAQVCLHTLSPAEGSRQRGKRIKYGPVCGSALASPWYDGRQQRKQDC